MSYATRRVTACLLSVFAVGCSRTDRAWQAAPPHPIPPPLVEVASFQGVQFTGVAVSKAGRIFLCSPRWHDGHRVSVAELMPDGTTRPYPDETWNAWDPAGSVHPREGFVCVQSVHVDDKDRLWILDPASPRLEGVVEGGPKLVEVDLADDTVEQVISFGRTIAPAQSYLNDVRVDTADDTGYITDSGLGAIVVVDLKTGRARRVLDGHPSTKADPTVVPVVGGRELRFPDGKVPQIYADGLALDAPRGDLYYQALTGRTLHRVKTGALKDPALTPALLGGMVETLGETVVTDGMIADAAGNVYFSALERDAIVARRPSGEMVTIVQDPAIAWPDSFAFGPDGDLFFTASQIHRTSWFSPDGSQPSTPYRLFRTRPLAAETRRR